MARGLSIDIGANTRDFIKGVGDMGDALQEVGDALDDVARDGQDSGEKLERAFKEVQRENEKTERSFRDLGNTADRELRGVGSSADINFKRAGDASGTFKQEAIQNLGEVSSSFDGSMQGIAAGFQGVAGGAGASLIGLGGVAAGIGAALVGVGIAGGAIFDAIGSNAEFNKERVKTAQDDMLENNSKFLSDIYFQNESARIWGEQKDQIIEWSDQLGLSSSTVLAALAGVPAAIDTVTDAQDRLIKKESEGLTPGEAREKNRGLRQDMDQLTGAIDATTGAIGDARQGFDVLNGVDVILGGQLAEVSTEADGLNASLSRIPKETTATVKVTVEKPDIIALLGGVQRDINTRGPLKVGLATTTPYGKVFP